LQTLLRPQTSPKKLPEKGQGRVEASQTASEIHPSKNPELFAEAENRCGIIPQPFSGLEKSSGKIPRPFREAKTPAG
jgi:hypothetical protein